MMGFVEEFYTQFETLLVGLAETQFGALATVMSGTAQLICSVVAVFVLIRMGMRGGPTGEEAWMLFWRFVVVALFLSSWTFFAQFVYALQDSMDQIAGLMATPSNVDVGGGVARQFDRMIARVGEVATSSAGRLNIAGAVMNGIFWLMLVLLGALAAVGMIVSLIMFTIIVSLAPLAIVATLLEGTQPYFSKWLDGLVFSVLFPVILSAVLGMIILMAQQTVFAYDTNPETIGGTMNHGMFITLSMIMIALTPFIASLITGNFQASSILARAGVMVTTGGMAAAGIGAAAASGAGSAAARGAAGAAPYVRSAASNIAANSGISRHDNGTSGGGDSSNGVVRANRENARGAAEEMRRNEAEKARRRGE